MWSLSHLFSPLLFFIPANLGSTEPTCLEVLLLLFLFWLGTLVNLANFNVKKIYYPKNDENRCFLPDLSLNKKNSLKFFHISKNTRTSIEQFKVIMALWAYVQRFSLPEDCLWIEPFPRKKQNKAKQRKKRKIMPLHQIYTWTHTLRFAALWPLLLIPQIYRVLISGTEQHIADT